MPATVAIVVNSCLSYHRHTLPPLLASLRRAGVDPADVFVVVGDAPEHATSDEAAARVWFVPWSNIDDTGLIWAVSPEGREALRGREWIFYLHDTTSVMPKFGHDVQARRLPPSSADDTAAPIAAVPLKPFPAMSMGYYRVAALWGAGEAILATRNDDTSEQGRVRAKNVPDMEDGVFRLLLGRDHVTYPGDVLNPHECAVHREDGSPYGGVTRIRETWDVPGLYKYKANWGQSAHWGVSL